MKRVFLVVLTIALMMTLISCGQETAVEVEKEKEISVEVSNPTVGSLVNETSLVGRLQAKATATTMGQLAVPEEILEVRFEVGDYVSKDDVIIVLDTESTDDQVENARLSYETARRNYNAMLESVNTNKANLERTQALFDSGIVSKQQLEAAELQASDGQLKTLGNQLNQAKFAYENAQKGLDNTTILAPISGIISSMNFEENNLATSQNMIVITDMSEMEMTLEITEDILSKINDQTSVELRIESTGETMPSSIKSLNPVADQRTGLYGMVVSMTNEDMTIKPGMFARATIQFTGQESYLVPIDSVLMEDDMAYVYTVVDGKAIKTQVAIGEDDGEVIEILEGLDKDSALVVSGQNYISEESLIRVVNGGQ